MPGVKAAALVDFLPLNHENASVTLGLPQPAEGAEPTAYRLTVSAGFFDAMGIPVRNGRTFDIRDDAGAPGRIVVNREFVRRYLPSGPAVGTSVGLRGISASRTAPRQADGSSARSHPFEMIGVVGDAVQRDLSEGTRPVVYLSMRQVPTGYFRVLLKASEHPLRHVRALRELVRELDPGLALSEVRTLEHVVQEYLLPQRAMAASLSVLSAGGMPLAGVGLDGLMALLVRLRGREMAIRMAMGAQAHR